MPAPVSVVVPAHNQLVYCRQCVESVTANTGRAYRLVLVDNGSTDGVSEYFDSVPGAEVIHNGENLGFAAAVNQGMRGAPGHVLLLNSDTIVPPGWLERLEKALSSAEDVGMVGPVSNEVSGNQRIETPVLDSVGAIDDFAAQWARRHSGEWVETVRLVGFCLLIRGSVAGEVGLFDERFGIGNCEDDDYCLRVVHAGYRLLVARDAFVFHYGNKTFEGMGFDAEAYEAAVERNYRLLLEKWEEYASENPVALEQARLLNRQAREARDGHDVKGALRLLKEAIEAFPTLALNYNDLGVVLWELGEHGRAVEAFTKAVGLDAADAEARENLEDARRFLDGGE